MLSADTPYITRELFLPRLWLSVYPPSELPELELYFLTSLTYMHLHCSVHEHFSVGQIVVKFDNKMSSALRDKHVTLSVCTTTSRWADTRSAASAIMSSLFSNNNPVPRQVALLWGSRWSTNNFRTCL
eukprot:gene26804-33443_t